MLGQRSILSKKIDTLEDKLQQLEADLENERDKHKEIQILYEEINRNVKEETKEEPLRNDNEIEELRNKLKISEDEALKYRQQCDSLSAQLSRAQAVARKKNGSIIS